MESTENGFQMCRLCLNLLNDDSIAIFNSYIANELIIDIIKRICIKISIKKDDKFSQFICENCYEIIQNCHFLSEKSIQSEKQSQIMSASDAIVKEESMEYDELMMCNNLVKPDIELIEGAEIIDPDIPNDEEEQEEEEEEEKPKPKRIKRHQCLVCCKLFEKPSKLARHEKTHDVNKKPFACEECFQRFERPESLERHKIMHSGMTLKIGPDHKNWPCIICKKVFDTQTTMASHMRCHKSEMEKLEFPCNLCSKVFQKLNDLTR